VVRHLWAIFAEKHRAEEEERQRRRATKGVRLEDEKIWGSKRSKRRISKTVEVTETEEVLRRKEPRRGLVPWRTMIVDGEQRVIRGMRGDKKWTREEKGKGRAY
jgi:hypothetical protein